MATTDLQLDEPGSLARPGPIGRIVRLAFGALCLSYVVGLVEVSGDLITDDGHIISAVWNGILVGLFLISYVINIGFSRAWKKWPALVSASIFLVVGGFGYLSEGTIETTLLAHTVWGWELYVFSHLGVAFIISAFIATPGCEMRAFHDLYSRLSGVPTKEHYCPVGPLHAVDKWEARASQRST
ncbi:MAG TPA: hypothetical protein PKH39_06640 [Woeseiaceae bacterium]|nr:hypothetical protein [Woeseiaceae bacterium]